MVYFPWFILTGNYLAKTVCGGYFLMKNFLSRNLAKSPKQKRQDSDFLMQNIVFKSLVKIRQSCTIIKRVLKPKTAVLKLAGFCFGCYNTFVT